jgi:hypothetical protein
MYILISFCFCVSSTVLQNTYVCNVDDRVATLQNVDFQIVTIEMPTSLMYILTYQIPIPIPILYFATTLHLWLAGSVIYWKLTLQHGTSREYGNDWF